MKYLLLLSLLLSSFYGLAQNSYPEINNLSVQFDDNNQMLSIDFDLFDAENESMEISLLVSDDNGLSYRVNTQSATGDIGYPIESGIGKSIVWNAAGNVTGGKSYQLKLIADDRYEIDIQSIVDQVDSNQLLNNLEFIEGTRQRTFFSDKLEEVKDSIEGRFLSEGLISSRQDVPQGNYTGQNIIGTKLGTTNSDNVYIIDAHFDTVNNCPGADDNGSGVAGFLEALRVLSPYNFAKTLRFIGFDLEEDGLIGAFAYTNEKLDQKETIEGVYNLEMIGYYTDEPNSQSLPTGFSLLYASQYAAVEADQFRGNFIANIGDQNSTELMASLENAAAGYVPGFKVISIPAPASWQTLTPDFGRSDHAPFWLKGIPALLITDTSNFRNDNYHTSADSIGTLDFTFMSNVVKAVVGSVAEQAEIQHSTAAISEFSVLSSTEDELDCNYTMAPVPTDDLLNLRFEDCHYNVLGAEVYDILGSLHIKKEIQAQYAEGFNLNVSGLKAGTYILRLKTGSKSTSRKLFIY